MVKQKESFEQSGIAKPVSKKLKKVNIPDELKSKKKAIKPANLNKASNSQNKAEYSKDVVYEEENHEDHEIDNQDADENEIISEVEESEENIEESKQEEGLEPEPIKEKNQLIKNLTPEFIISAIYTGGKIQLSNLEKDIYSICNNEIVCFSLDENKIKRKIVQVKELFSEQ